jgi:hypothetical protein
MRGIDHPPRLKPPRETLGMLRDRALLPRPPPKIPRRSEGMDRGLLRVFRTSIRLRVDVDGLMTVRGRTSIGVTNGRAGLTNVLLVPNELKTTGRE